MYPAYDDRWEDYPSDCPSYEALDLWDTWEDGSDYPCSVCEQPMYKGECWDCEEQNAAWMLKLEEEYDTETQFVIEETWGYFEDGDLRVPAGVSRMLWTPN